MSTAVADSPILPPPVAAAKSSRLRPLLVGGAAVAAVAAAVTVWFIHAAGHEVTDNAMLDGRVHPLSTRVAGMVSELLVEDYATVRAGQPIARLDPRDAEIALQEARSQLAVAQAGIPQAEAALAQAQAQVGQSRAAQAQAAAQERKAGLDFERARSLFQAPENGSRVISRSEFDSAQASLDVTRAAVASAMAAQEAAAAALRAAEAGLGVARARRDTAEAAFRNAELQLSYTTLTAPVAGRLGKRNLEVGQRVSPGQSLVALVGSDVWVTANFKESQLARMRVGQEVRVSVDAIPGHVFRGRVESLSPGTGAKFALLPPDNATGNFTKIVQRVPVRIALEPDSVRGYEDRLRAGLSVVAEVLLK
ncbi:MAG: HlyD family secretion protein [Verrucomicrobia bacterium]|nr:HlyD family secretion protein [Verrucomicrobiota bacterium]